MFHKDTIVYNQKERIKLKINAMLQMATVLSTCSTCSRLSVGAIITDTNFRILSAGYNGRTKGIDHCKDTNPTGNKDECHCIHAEQNAIAHCLFTDDKKYAFVTAFPCGECVKLLASIKVIQIFYIDPYKYFNQSAKVADLYQIKYRHITI